MAAILFALSQPNFLIVQGIPILAYIMYVPVFLFAGKLSWKTLLCAGLLYGVLSYCFFVYWLAVFHPLSMLFIALLYGVWMIAVFSLLKIAGILFPRRGWLVQWIIWIAYEYVKTLGFAGFHYGVTAYSHWGLTRLIQIADITGVWGLSALIVFPSAWISAVIAGLPQHGRLFDAAVAHKISAFCWLAAFFAVIAYGFAAPIDYSGEQTVKVALIQQNSNPWKPQTGVPVDAVSLYRHDFQTLRRLSSEALASDPEIDFVVLPETAFVPSIVRHYRERKYRSRFELVADLLTYLDSETVPFVIGNDHAEQEYTQNGKSDWRHYNSALIFTPKENVLPPDPLVYRKMHLVPLSESFPLAKRFPKIAEILQNSGMHLWEQGQTPNVFSVAGVRFGTPICFEDTFGSVVRRFVIDGAQAIVNLSNDTWSKSLACQYQHLSMAVFRSVENRIPSVRATTSGQTAIIDPNGSIRAMAPPFTSTYLVGTIPVRTMQDKTLYTRFGDYVGIAFAVSASLLLLGGAIYKARTICKNRAGK